MLNTTMNITTSPDIVITEVPPTEPGVSRWLLVGVATGAAVILAAVVAGLIVARVLYLR